MKIFCNLYVSLFYRLSIDIKQLQNNPKVHFILLLKIQYILIIIYMSKNHVEHFGFMIFE